MTAGRAAVALALALAACTSPSPPSPDPTAAPTPAPSPTADDAHVLGVIASVTGPSRLADRPFLDGMALAEAELNGGGGVAGRPLRLEVVDDAGDAPAPARALSDMLRADGPEAILVVGEGRPVAALRPEVQARGRPVVLLGADLYSDRLLSRQVFQTSPPLRWQARAVARYLSRDRGHRRIVAVQQPGDPARAAFLDELRREGVDVEATLRPGDGRLADRAEGADALIALVDLERLDAVLRAVDRLDDPPQLVLPADLLRTDLDGVPPGTVAPGPYTWAPWARPLSRVRAFRTSFRRTIGRIPVASEQEGYDAVRILAAGLEAGRTGDGLVRFLERHRPTGPVYSSTSVTLGPDDHLFQGELWLGLYTVPGPGERPEPWLAGTPWRPIIRTFTYTGQRTLFPERDRRVFFPFWRPGRPSPRFRRSRWGIVTGPEDPLH
ncbi:MAG TPA: ABC transporter substrate-binding protein [Actinomycetota bacterium]